MGISMIFENKKLNKCEKKAKDSKVFVKGTFFSYNRKKEHPNYERKIQVKKFVILKINYKKNI